MVLRSAGRIVLFLFLVSMIAGCATVPGGIAPSTVPIEGRSYTNLGPSAGTDSAIRLLGIFPISTGNSTRDAMETAIGKKGGDALINVTVEYYTEFWILFSRAVTEVQGDVIKFDKP